MSKEDPGIPISGTEYFKAQAHWVKFWDDQKREIPSFSNYLGISGGFKKAKSLLNPTYMLRRSAVRKIQILTGPHWYAVLKAYQIRKGS